MPFAVADTGTKLFSQAITNDKFIRPPTEEPRRKCRIRLRYNPVIHHRSR